METQSNTLLAIIVIVVLMLAGFMFMQSQQSILPQPLPTENEEETVVCTMDAMQCSDGSYVGRTGPNCEFVCPDGSVTQ